MNGKRVFVAIDIENLWYAAREAFGKNYRVDFQRLRKLISEGNPVPSIIEAIAYVVVGPDHDNTAFIGMLERLQYKVKKRYMRYDKIQGIASKSDWDVGITVDTMRRAMPKEIDKFVLVSGDGDYIFLVEELQGLGIEVEVHTFENVCNEQLKNMANRLVLLNENVVFNTAERNPQYDG